MSFQSSDVRLDHLCASLYPFVLYNNVESNGIYEYHKRNSLTELLESSVNVCALLPSCHTASIGGTIDVDQSVHLYICASGSPIVKEEVTKHLEGWVDQLKALKSDSTKHKLEEPEHEERVRDLVLFMYRPCWTKLHAKSETYLDPLNDSEDPLVWTLYHQDLHSHLKRYIKLALRDDLDDEDFLVLHDICTEMRRSMKEHPSEDGDVNDAIETLCTVTRAVNAFVHAALSPSDKVSKLLDSLRSIKWVELPPPRRFLAKITSDNLKSLLGSHPALQDGGLEWTKVVELAHWHANRDPPFGHPEPDGTVIIDEDITAHCEAVLMRHFAENLGIRSSHTYVVAAGGSCYGCMEYAQTLNMTYSETRFITFPLLDHPMAVVWVCPPGTEEEVKTKLEQVFAEHLSLLYASFVEDIW